MSDEMSLLKNKLYEEAFSFNGSFPSFSSFFSSDDNSREEIRICIAYFHFQMGEDGCEGLSLKAGSSATCLLCSTCRTHKFRNWSHFWKYEIFLHHFLPSVPCANAASIVNTSLVT